MTFTICIIFSVFCILAVNAFDLPMETEEIRAIQDRLDRLDGIEKKYKSMVGLEENREEACIPIGGGCSFASGPNCCGIRTRCKIMDYATSTYGGNAVWHSACREYNIGVALDEIARFFKRLG